MMENQNAQWNTMIVGMIKATNTGKMEWWVQKYDKKLDEEAERVEFCYGSNFEKQKLMLYKRQYKDYRGIRVPNPLQSIFLTQKLFEPDPNEKIWYSEIRLDISSDFNQLLYRITDVESLKDLLLVVMEKVANLEGMKKYFEGQ
jgi:hypothetical protein